MQKLFNRTKQAGFTLIELSISIVIIGLIVAGVVAGGDLIAQAKLQDIVSTLKKYEVAINTFKLKYDGLPGDITNGASYWPASTNGNGNDRILFTENEDRQVFYQLTQSGILPGSYAIDADGLHALDVEYPSGPHDGSGYVILDRNSAPYGTPIVDHVRYAKHGGSWIGDPILIPADSKKIDLKIDDGLPDKGKYISKYIVNCTDSSSSPANYVLTTTTQVCTIQYQVD